jgi:hypothetical protein
MNGYELSRNWFDWSFENPELITPTHTAIYFFAIEHCNRLGWKDKFGFPTQMAMDAIGVKKHQTFTKHFTDLVEWGFIGLVQKSKNQYSANIISLKSAMPKNGKALDKAMIKHGAKQSQSTGQSMDSIDKQETNKQGTINVSERKLKFASTLEPFQKLYPKQMLSDFYKYWGELNKSGTKFKQELEKTWDLERRLEMWARRDKDFNKNQTTHSGPLAFSSKTINK